MRHSLRAIVDSPRFNALIVGVIIINAVLIGWYTYDPARWILAAEWVCLAIFTAELVMRFMARRSIKEFLTDGWNLFDLVVVGAAYLEIVLDTGNGIGPIFRILRVFRVLRLVKTVPELRLIVAVLAKSIVSMKYIGLLSVILFYVYAVIGVKLFGTIPDHPLREKFLTVHEAFFTLFRVLTGDDWTEMRYAAATHASGWIVTAYFVSWILIATFILINLIVGAIINNYQEVQEIESRKHVDASDLRLRELADELQAILQKRSG